MSKAIETKNATGLVALTEGKRFLAQARDTLQVLDLRNKAAAVEHYLRQRDDSGAAAIDAAELRLRAERRLGELLAETVDHGGDRRSKSRDVTLIGKLPEDITKMQSHRYQQAAKVPEAKFENLVESAREKGDIARLTSAAVMRLAKEVAKEEKVILTANAVASLTDESFQVSVARMEDLLPSLSSVDAIITDPPYPEEYLPLYGELARQAKTCLSDDGILAVMCPQSHLPRILELMTPHINYRWTMAYLTPGGQSVQIWPKKVNTFWKPILLFGGSPEWIGDVAKSHTNDNDKIHHHWGQSESGMMDLVQKLTRPGQLVCDPFLGGGTTGVASLLLGRRFVGCDIDDSSVETAKRRIAMALKGGRHESA